VEEIMMQIGGGRFAEARALIGGDEDILTRVVRRLNSHGISCRKAGRLAEAVNSFESATLVCDDDEGLYFNLTRVYMEGGQMQQAKETIRKALALNPEFGEAKDLLERITLKMAA
jgi:tetratricopeptide (TPR) repeat protein